MTEKLSVYTFGGLRILDAGEPLAGLESRKIEALFIYLASADRPQPREVLAELLWDDRTQQQAGANLRRVLSGLRKHFGPYVEISRNTAALKGDCDLWLDLRELQTGIEGLKAKSDRLTSEIITQADQALRLYHGDFLAGFHIRGARNFDVWLSEQCEHWRQVVLDTVDSLGDIYEADQLYKDGIDLARWALQIDPLQESLHRQLMRLLALDGQRSAALAQYETCCRLLASELDVEPMLETNRLYESIRDGTLEKVPHLIKREPPAPGEPPFKGLQYFDETDADLFFGREALVFHLVKQIQSRMRTKGARFLAIIGASGSGKSSLVRAGLIPALKRKRTVWQARVITPTEHPLEQLSSSLKDNQVAKGNTLLFVDQFEELFTLCQDENERKSFIDNLLSVAQEICVVIALRADFYGACAPYETLRKILSQNQEYIGPMDADELRLAIEEPAHLNGWLYEPALVDLLLNDIGASGDRSPEPGALPLLSHALLETWHRRSGRMLTLAGYIETGKISQAITKTAESVFEHLSPQEQAIARNIFLRMTELGEGTQETRRRVPLSEIIPPAESATSPDRTTEKVLKMLSDARLVITTDATAEVAHEALIREWDRLRDWLAENREGIRLLRHITESAREWENQGHDLELAYRGTRLAQALEWADSHPQDLNVLEREFLETSKALAEQETAERQAQKQRELEAARKLAESERQRAEVQARTAKQLRRRAYVLAGILLIALLMAVVAFVLRNTADRQAHLSAARELALASVNNLDVDAELSILLALQAVSESNRANVTVPYQVQDALHRAIQSSRIKYTLKGHTGDMLAVAFSPDGKLLVTASDDQTAKIWQAETGEELATLRGHSLAINDIAFSPDGKVLATVSDDKTAKIWNVASGQELNTLTGHAEDVWSVSFSGDGQLLATGSGTEAKVWDLNTGKLSLDLEGQRGPLAFSPLGKQLATSGIDGTTNLWNSETWEHERSLPYSATALTFNPDGDRLATAMTELKVWDVATGQELVNATGFAANVSGLAFSPDGSQLATGSQDGSTILWDSYTGKRLFALAGHAAAINEVSFSPECLAPPDSPFEWCGAWLATASRDGTARVWDVSPAGNREVATLPGFSGGFLGETSFYTVDFISPNQVEVHTWDIPLDGKSKSIASTLLSHQAPIIAGNISPDVSLLVTVDLENNVKVWDLGTGEELSAFTVNHTGAVTAVVFSADGTRLATSSDDGTAKVWDIPTGKGLITLSNHAGPVFAVAFAPNGRRIATASADGTAKIWDDTSGAELFTLTGHTMPVNTVSFSADGKLVATGGMDQSVRIWDAETGKQLRTLSGHSASILAVGFSPDGSLLATGGHDATTKLWDATSGDELLTITGHDGFVGTLSFSPDSKLLAAGSFQDGTIQIYMLEPDQLAALAQSRLTRSLTIAECQKYLHQDVCP